MLSDAVRTSVYFHLRTPVPGLSDTGYQLGLVAYDNSVPFYNQPSALYERVLNLRPSEESLISGLPIAELIFTGTPLLLGSVTATASLASGGAAIEIGTYAVQAADLISPEPLLAITSGLVQAINSSNTPYTAYLGPHEPAGPMSAAQASMSVVGLVPQAFNVALQVANVGGYVATQGTLPTINRTFSGPPVTTVYGLVPLLDYLQAAIAGSSDYAAFTKVELVGFDSAEIKKRIYLYRYYQLRLAEFFFGSKGMQYLSGGRSGGAIA